MKSQFLVPAIIIIGLATLFLFPEPETNFIAYALTTIVFMILLALAIKFQKKYKK